ncbi:hypothetical protein BDFG_07700 [Blastomyces dermatitidis ATCC 26199]|nr:hypothetical protein BDFG_07700 [Blastomyces dermatitidis ATCC 26199]
MSTRTTRARKIKESETGPVDSRGGSGSSSATENNDSIDQGTTMAERVQQQSSVESPENISPSSTGSTRLTSPVQATRTWELTAHSSVCCEKSAAGEAIHIILSSNPLNFQPSRSVPDWTRSIHTALAESRPIMPFQQMYKPLGQEEVCYIRKRLEEYTDEVRRHIHKLDGFDCAVILADARTLFSYIALLESTIKTYQVQLQSKFKLKPSHNPRREPCNQLGLQARKTVESGGDDIRNTHADLQRLLRRYRRACPQLKAERKERKLELQETRDRNREAKDSQRTFDRDKESEVQEMYDSLKNAKPSEIALEQIVGKNFRLYSVDHVDYCYSSDMYPSKYVEFYHLDKNDPSGQLLPARQETQMHGHYAGLEEFRLESTRGKCGLVFQFISNDYVKLKVPREVVFANRDLPAEAPEVFEFAGIRYDREKGKAERKRKRSPSPRETWFEMNHLMGWWNQSRLY